MNRFQRDKPELIIIISFSVQLRTDFINNWRPFMILEVFDICLNNANATTRQVITWCSLVCKLGWYYFINDALLGDTASIALPRGHAASISEFLYLTFSSTENFFWGWRPVYIYENYKNGSTSKKKITESYNFRIQNKKEI
jgi:hypothetical protein